MRRSLAALVAVFSLALPSVGAAQSRSMTMLGQIVDAGGRGFSGRTVELVSDGVIVGTTTSSYDGRFTFAVTPGNFVVRTTVNGHPAGTRVFVKSGASAPMALIVLPTATTWSPQVGAAVSAGVNGLIAGTTITVSTALAAVTSSISNEEAAAILADPDVKAEIVSILNTVIQTVNPGASPVTLQNGNIVIPPASISGGVVSPGIVQAINQIVNNVPTGSGH